MEWRKFQSRFADCVGCSVHFCLHATESSYLIYLQLSYVSIFFQLEDFYYAFSFVKKNTQTIT